MSFSGFVKGRWKSIAAQVAHCSVLAGAKAAQLDQVPTDWPRSLLDPTGFYLDCHRYFYLRLPPELRAHRAFFRHRGFGEDAFHSAWFTLFQQLQPASFLEIGVYRGQILSLALLLQERFGCAGTVAGISPFSPASDSVSDYQAGLDYEADTRINCRRFSPRDPKLVRAYSTDGAAIDFIRSRLWDCIYIDGNHDYEVALADWKVSSANVRSGGAIILDDSGLDTRFIAPVFATKGHSGPSRVAAGIDRSLFTEILQVGHIRVFQKR
jgi:hypothetical protein